MGTPLAHNVTLRERKPHKAPEEGLDDLGKARTLAALLAVPPTAFGVHCIGLCSRECKARALHGLH